MQVVVLGAGIIGVSTAWHLLQRGHEVTIVDRQPDAALETSFANAAQISVSYCEPWANRDAPLKALKWMFSPTAPLLFRPQMDPAQWRWGLQFLGQCNDAAFERNVAQIVALGAYSHAALKDVVADTGIEYNRLECGIAHYYSEQQSFDGAAEAAALMQKFGVKRNILTREELLKVEPALSAYADRIVGGTFTPSDESGDAKVFTQQLAALCAPARCADAVQPQRRTHRHLGRCGHGRAGARPDQPAGALAEGRCLCGGLRLLHHAADEVGGCLGADLPRQGLQRHPACARSGQGPQGEHDRRLDEDRHVAPG